MIFAVADVTNDHVAASLVAGTILAAVAAAANLWHTRESSGWVWD